MTEPLTISRFIRKLSSHQKIRGDIPVGVLSNETGKVVPLVLRTDTRGVLAVADSGEEAEIEGALDADPGEQLAGVQAELKSAKARIISLEDEIKVWEKRVDRAQGDLRTLQDGRDDSKARSTRDKQHIKKLEERIKTLERDLALVRGDLDAERAARDMAAMNEAKDEGDA